MALWCLVSALFGGTMVTLMTALGKSYSSVQILMVLFLANGIFMAGELAKMKQLPSIKSPSAALMFGAVCVMCYFHNKIGFTQILKATNPAYAQVMIQGSMFIFIALAARMFLGKDLSLIKVGGMFVVLVGIALILWERK